MTIPISTAIALVLAIVPRGVEYGDETIDPTYPGIRGRIAERLRAYLHSPAWRAAVVASAFRDG